MMNINGLAIKNARRLASTASVNGPPDLIADEVDRLFVALNLIEAYIVTSGLRS